jgi:hypothetical protein
LTLTVVEGGTSEEPKRLSFSQGGGGGPEEEEEEMGVELGDGLNLNFKT